MSLPSSVAHPSGRLAVPRRGIPADRDARALGRCLADLLALTKPRIVVMVLVTTIAGYHAGLRAGPDWVRMMHLLLGTALAAGGTLALNQYLERDLDALMGRTRRRPLPGGRLWPREALTFGAATAVAGTVYLGLGVNVWAAGITSAISVLYLLVYTPLKPRTPLCTLPGAVSGALPPLIGWAASADGLEAEAWLLFGIVFLWQLPHTLAVARLYRDDYARAGMRLLPVVDRQGRWTGRAIVASSTLLTAVSVLPAVAGRAGGLYLAGAMAAGAVLVGLGVLDAREASRRTARRVLLASLLYLPIVLGLLAYARG